MEALYVANNIRSVTRHSTLFVETDPAEMAIQALQVLEILRHTLLPKKGTSNQLCVGWGST
jgi:hypothetical protein